MALTAAELETVREIVGYLTLSAIEDRCTEYLAGAAQETAMRDDIELWEPVRDDHFIMAGGSDGIDINSKRDRRAIRNRVLQRLGEEVPSSAGGIFQIPVGTAYPDYC